MENERKFRENMAIFGAIFDKKIPIQYFDIYWEVLKPYNDKECVLAFGKVVKTCKFFPKPADLIEKLEEGKPQAADKALNEANKIIAHLNSYDIHKPLRSQDVITKHLMTNVWNYPSWSREFKKADSKWWIKEFVGAYLSVSSDKLLELEIIEKQKKIAPKSMLTILSKQDKLSVFGKQMLSEIELEKRKQQKYRKIDLKQLVKSI